MAVTTYGTNNALAVKTWSKLLTVEVLKNTWLTKFMGTDQTSLIQIKDELRKSAGDQITFGLRMQMTGDGVLGDDSAEGSEEPLVTYSDAVKIDQLRHQTRSKGEMSEQRVPFDVREQGMGALRDWWAARLDESGFNQLCGYVPQADIRHSGMQAVIAPDSNHIIRPLVSETTDEGIASTSLFSLSMLDKAVERARTSTPAMRPVRVGGKDMYVAFIHDYQVMDMRTSTSTGQWLDIQKAAMTGGEVKDNPIFDGSLGVYNGVIIHQDTRVTNGVNSGTSASVANVRRAVVLGAQAGVIAYGRRGGAGPEKFRWVEKLFDFDNQLGISAALIFGMKKTVYNSADYATLVLSSYAASH